MGRRPNPLVVEFFERGAKLDDNSNRYEHTCKRCGEVFPKGRVDSLTGHLLRKCHNVSAEDRQWVVQQIQRPPDSHRVNKQPAQAVNGLQTSDTRQETSQLGLTQATFSHHSALETLAEVSSSQLGLDGQLQHQNSKSLSEVIAEQALIARLQEENGLGATATSAETSGSYLYATDTPQPVPYLSGASSAAAEHLSASPLIQAASAANHQLEQAQAHSTDHVQRATQVDPELNGMGGPLQDIHSSATVASNQRSDDDLMSWNPTAVSIGQQTFGAMSLPTNDSTSGFGLLQKTGQSKTRGRFNDERRKEVQEIRKQGACLRCRMLKKSCSGETPCSTCRNVETARVWKRTCIRTKLADAFPLYSTSLFHSKARLSMSAALHGLEQFTLPGRIEAGLFGVPETCMSFGAKSHIGSLPGVDPHLQGSAQDSMTTIVLDESHNISEKLEKYANRVADSRIASETSSFMRVTLQKAQALAETEVSEQFAKANAMGDRQAPRACYNHQSYLLKNVVELWVVTQFLASPEKSDLQLRYDLSKVPRNQPDDINWTAEQHSSVNDINRELVHSSPSYRLISAQLLSAAETRCSRLSKIVMNELERRLLQRQQVSRFATLLTAIVLLNCIERMSGIYRRFDDGQQLSSNSFNTPQSTEGTISFPSMETAWGEMSYRITDDPSFWPLDTLPSRLWPQGPQFAQLLTMLLRIRGLPPQTSKTQDGTLAVTRDFGLSVHINGRPVREQMEDHLKAPAEWLDPLHMNVSELLQQRDEPLPGKDDPVEAWDMRFIAKVLLPDRM